jgi:hypothetical protein
MSDAQAIQWSREIVARDGRCIICGEARREYLCGHHIITRGNPASRLDPRNGVALCNLKRERWVDGLGLRGVDCHELAESNREWFLPKAMRRFIDLGYFRNATEYVRWVGVMRCGEDENEKAS